MQMTTEISGVYGIFLGRPKLKVYVTQERMIMVWPEHNCQDCNLWNLTPSGAFIASYAINKHADRW